VNTVNGKEFAPYLIIRNLDLIINHKTIGLLHRLRMDFLDVYQQLVLDEPTSGVNQPLKEAFLALRQATESDQEDLNE